MTSPLDYIFRGRTHKLVDGSTTSSAGTHELVDGSTTSSAGTRELVDGLVNRPPADEHGAVSSGERAGAVRGERGGVDAQQRDQRRSGALLVVAAATLWSTGGVGVKVAEAEPLVIAGLRSAFALAFMLLVIGAKGRANLGALATLLRRPLVWAAAVSYALMVVTFVLAARRTTAANAIFIQYTGPVYVALLSGPLLGEEPTRRDLFAIVGCVLGMALAFGGELEAGRSLGNALAVLSSFGFGGLPLLLRLDQKRMARAGGAIGGHAPLVAMSLGNALAALVALPAIVAHPVAGPGQLRTLVVLFLLGTLQIGLPYVFYAVAVQRLRALESSLLATIEPVLSPIWVLLATGERPSAMASAGGAVIVAAVVLQTIGKRAAG